MKIVITSGKGGTGKSTLSANLSYSLSRTRDIVLVDCDVEEPNLHLFFNSEPAESTVTRPVPCFDEQKCNLCGKCGEFCQYGAIVILKNRIMFFKELCHSCGGCRIICPNDAISEEQHPLGKIWDMQIDSHLRLVTGVLNEGEASGVKVITEAKNAAEGNPLIIYDSSPGISCPVIETVEGADYCILVTESTPFGLHDLELAAMVVKKLGIPAGVVINRSDGKDEETEEFCRKEGLEILLKIPFDIEIAAIQNRGELFSAVKPEWQTRFAALYEHISEICGGEK